MKKVLVFLCSALLTFGAIGTAGAAFMTYNDLGAFQAASVSLTLDDFESAPWSPANVALTQPVTNLGVSWTAAEQLMAVTTLSVSGSQAISSIDRGTDILDELFADLPAGITAVGGWVANVGGGNDVGLFAFDGANNLLGSVVAPLAPLGFGEFRFIGVTSDVPIDRVVFASLQQPPADNFGLDDFYFGEASGVPEPATLLLIGTGLVGLVGFRRRFRK